MSSRFIYYVLLALCAVAVVGCDKKRQTPMRVQELVELYSQKRGADNVAGPELKRMGTPARDELIQILDKPKTSEEKAGMIIEILHVYFPCEQSYQAMDRFASRIEDPKQRESFQQIIALIKSSDPRKH